MRASFGDCYGQPFAAGKRCWEGKGEGEEGKEYLGGGTRPSFKPGEIR